MGFEIPIVLFIFKRKDTALLILKQISKIKPSKLYLISDEGRNEEEKKSVAEVRKALEESINWDCQVIKNYAEENRGVYGNIALGAKWVFDQEEKAIFLEDDNLPEITFFEFCREMLERYNDDSRVLWICGTNYLGSYKSPYNLSYVFTRHMLPCGWASWANKFNMFYDYNLSLCTDEFILKNISKQYYNKSLYIRFKDSWLAEYERISRGRKPISWDYHMDISIKANNLFGICPCNNQIKNIGVDTLSTHGGNSLSNVMTKRFCGMDSYPIEFPLKHPAGVIEDQLFEKKIANIMTMPLPIRIKGALVKTVRRCLKIPLDVSTKIWIKNRFKKNV